MTYIRLKFVAKKRDYKDDILGFVWSKGETQDVPRESAPFYLYHGDVWRDARKKADREADVIVPREKPLKSRRIEEEIPHANFKTMTEAGLNRYAQMYLDQRGALKMPLPELRAHVESIARRRSI